MEVSDACNVITEGSNGVVQGGNLHAYEPGYMVTGNSQAGEPLRRMNLHHQHSKPGWPCCFLRQTSRMHGRLAARRGSVCGCRNHHLTPASGWGCWSAKISIKFGPLRIEILCNALAIVHALLLGLKKDCEEGVVRFPMAMSTHPHSGQTISGHCSRKVLG